MNSITVPHHAHASLSTHVVGVDGGVDGGVVGVVDVEGVVVVVDGDDVAVADGDLRNYVVVAVVVAVVVVYYLDHLVSTVTCLCRWYRVEGDAYF